MRFRGHDGIFLRQICYGEKSENITELERVKQNAKRE